jgi:phosphopantothenoylcysteine synthetase/decarboxylase
VLDEIETIDEAAAHVTRHLMEHDIFAVIMALACLDYRPRETIQGKLSSDPEERTLTLVKCRKIIDEVKVISPSSLLVGFKLEVQISKEELFLRAEELARRVRCDLVVANRADEIGEDRHRAWFVSLEGTERRVRGPFETPEEIARALADDLARRGASESS